MITDIINSVSETIKDTVDEPTSRYYGIVQGYERDDETFEIEDANGQQITPDDNYNVQVYFKLGETTNNGDSERTFGKNMKEEFSLNTRGVVIAKKELGKNLIDTIFNALPKQVVDSNYRYVIIERGGIDQNQSAVYTDEFGEVPPVDFDFNIWSFNFNLVYVPC